MAGVDTDMNSALSKVALEQFQKKKERRRQLAALSFEEKIEILVRLQQLTSEISMQTRGTCRKPWWNSETARQL